MICLSWPLSACLSPLESASLRYAHEASVRLWRPVLWGAGTFVPPCGTGEFGSRDLFPQLRAAHWTCCSGSGTRWLAIASRWIRSRWTRCFPLSSVSSWRGNCARACCTPRTAVELQFKSLSSRSEWRESSGSLLASCRREGAGSTPRIE